VKTERHQGNALAGVSAKKNEKHYKKCKNPDRSELLIRDLTVAIDRTVAGVIFSGSKEL